MRDEKFVAQFKVKDARKYCETVREEIKKVNEELFGVKEEAAPVSKRGRGGSKNSKKKR